MKNLETITAPGGFVCSMLAMKCTGLDDAEAIVLMISAIVCALRSAWIAVKPCLKAIKTAIINYKERKNGNDKME